MILNIACLEKVVEGEKNWCTVGAVPAVQGCAGYIGGYVADLVILNYCYSS